MRCIVIWLGAVALYLGGTCCVCLRSFVRGVYVVAICVHLSGAFRVQTFVRVEGEGGGGCLPVARGVCMDWPAHLASCVNAPSYQPHLHPHPPTRVPTRVRTRPNTRTHTPSLRTPVSSLEMPVGVDTRLSSIPGYVTPPEVVGVALHALAARVQAVLPRAPAASKAGPPTPTSCDSGSPFSKGGTGGGGGGGARALLHLQPEDSGCPGPGAADRAAALGPLQLGAGALGAACAAGGSFTLRGGSGAGVARGTAQPLGRALQVPAKPLKVRVLY
jgi:hypothetical protein